MRGEEGGGIFWVPIRPIGQIGNILKWLLKMRTQKLGQLLGDEAVGRLAGLISHPAEMREDNQVVVGLGVINQRMADRPLAKIIFPSQDIGGVTASLGRDAAENIANAILH